MSCQPLKPIKKVKKYMPTKCNENRLIKPAKKFLLEYMSDGEIKTPSDFDWDILGKFDYDFILSGIPQWNLTPFFVALGQLVEEGKVIHKELKDGTQTYKINKL
jgi:hypothetical protein